MIEIRTVETSCGNIKLIWKKSFFIKVLQRIILVLASSK